MNSFRTMLLAAAILTATTAAHAVPILATAPAYADPTQFFLRCDATNVSTTSTLYVAVEARDYSGKVVASNQGGDFWYPGVAAGIDVPSPKGEASCAFKVLKGNAKYLRAAAVYRPLGAKADLIVVPAR